ncbi:NUDIX hydrolase [Vallicoccus soli]|uniref:NUDIX domain-containing protein n=1 Tax=Vallicoccus soli TaxID=2339232 RepID=A0A3A3Z814_9ACTN|nr:NUDIX hydrolase N-terminal domain-containing protein [Vallicoccus soli]RJK96967.1 NUDIX domain-containing protein [Vallicoccus soli]
MSAPAPWLGWVRELQSMAQAGLTYSDNPYDLERYARLRGLAAAMLAELADADPERVRLLLEAETGYLTPKLDVRAAVHDAEGRVLLVREVQDGLWTLPGGWADVGESLAEGAVREVREESGYVVERDRLLGFYERERWGHPPMPAFTLKAVVACRLVGGAPAHSTETDGVGWYARDALPPLSTGRCSPQLLARVFAHHDDPSLPPDLD